MAPGAGSRGNINHGAMPFRLNAKNVFLTFPQCDIPANEMGEHLSTLKPTRYIKVVREKHRDGNNHLHVLLQWIDKLNIRDQRFFDHRGHHPNIQAVRSLPDVLDYIDKAIPDQPSPVDVYEFGQLSLNRKIDKWMQVANATSEQEVLNAALEASPRDFVLQNDKIVEYARKKQRTVTPYQHDQSIQFNIPPELIAYMTNEFVNPVGLCPWILQHPHYLQVDENNSVVLKRCCSAVPPGPAKQRGQGLWEHTFTGGACRTSRHSTKTRNILSWTTSHSRSSPTRNNGGELN